MQMLFRPYLDAPALFLLAGTVSGLHERSAVSMGKPVKSCMCAAAVLDCKISLLPFWALQQTKLGDQCNHQTHMSYLKLEGLHHAKIPHFVRDLSRWQHHKRAAPAAEYWVQLVAVIGTWLHQASGITQAQRQDRGL
jgi:hypothetical protein